jgi:hypothetical protein
MMPDEITTYEGTAMAKNGKRLGFLPGWRKGTYIVLLFNLAMLAWIIGGTASAAKDANCGTDEACQAGTAVGTAIGVGLIIALWVAGDVILGIIWLVTNRKKTRECPQCGSDVKKGLIACPRCSYSWAAPVGA